MTLWILGYGYGYGFILHYVHQLLVFMHHIIVSLLLAAKSGRSADSYL
jgi:hypothetical protein